MVRKSTMIKMLMPISMAMVVTAIITACDNGSQGPAEGTQQASGETPSHVCSLLSREQVNAVIPGNKGCQDRDTSEAALFKDVEMEHSSYLHAGGTDMQFLDVIIYKASTDEGFEQIDIAKRARHGSIRKLNIGDIGFLDDLGGDNLMVTASKGRTVFELKLVSKDADAKSEQLTELARIVAGKL
jgi:hypothetical protein